MHSYRAGAGPTKKRKCSSYLRPQCKKQPELYDSAIFSLGDRHVAGRTAGPIKTKLGIGTHVDPESVLVKVMW